MTSCQRSHLAGLFSYLALLSSLLGKAAMLTLLLPGKQQNRQQTFSGVFGRPEQRPQQLRDAGAVRRERGVRRVQADGGEAQDPGTLLQGRRPRRGLCDARCFV